LKKKNQWNRRELLDWEHRKRTGAHAYFAGAVPYFRIKPEGGALPYFTGAQLYLSGAETVEYSVIDFFLELNIKIENFQRVKDVVTQKIYIRHQS
jgi:hypothetical protein